MPKNLYNTHGETETKLHDSQEIQDEFMASMLKLNNMFLEVRTQELEDFQRTLRKFNKDFSYFSQAEYWMYLTIAFILGVFSGIGIMKAILIK